MILSPTQPSRSLENFGLTIFRRQRKKKREKDAKTRQRLCLCLWESLSREKIPRPLKHLCHIFDVCHKKVRKEIARCNLNPTVIAPSHYLSALCRCLHLPFQVEKLSVQYTRAVEWKAFLMPYETNILLAACLRRIIKATPSRLLPRPPSFSSLCRELDLDNAKQRKRVKCLSRQLPRVKILSPPLSHDDKKNVVYRLRWL